MRPAGINIRQVEVFSLQHSVPISCHRPITVDSKLDYEIRSSSRVGITEGKDIGGGIVDTNGGRAVAVPIADDRDISGFSELEWSDTCVS